ncbi:UDP-glucose/GDP-mannose dehydrogenase family protein [Abyssibacter sp.]|uniref:UDP-glucose dehydrogenase family protein n=1 Tax=Abyssibacter sp. TaxID=2320200 RepID=UPI00351444AD
MNISIFGSGYVGLVTAACFAEAGNEVVCVDIDDARIQKLSSGHCPFYEPGMDELLARNVKAGRLQFTTDAKAAVEHGLFIMIAVGTPPDEDGSADLRHVLTVARTLGEHMREYKVVITKSTVPVGSSEAVRLAVQEKLQARGANVEFDVVSNPEFLKEGSAVEDFMKPDRTIVGVDNPRTGELMRALYAPFNRSRDRVIVMDIASSELTKYAANAMLATKISFMNELSNLADRVGADIDAVRRGIGSDPRIGYKFIYPGAGYGGSCFPKDISALSKIGQQVDYEMELTNAVNNVNARQKEVLFDKILRHFGDVNGMTFAIWGLAFKPNTDDVREAPARALIEALWNCGASVRVHDPQAMKSIEAIYGRLEKLVYCESPMDAANNADALAILTEWKVYHSPDLSSLFEALKKKVIFDGRNLFDPKLVSSFGLTYYSIGRPVATALPE